MQQYKVNKDRVCYLRKTIYKVHPKWKKRRVVRLTLLIVFIVCLIVTAIYTLKEPIGALTFVPYQERDTYIYKTSDYIAQLLIMEIAVCLFPGLIYFLYRLVLKVRCTGAVGRIGEVLILSDTEFRNIYDDTGYGDNAKYEIIFSFGDITKIVWNECQQRFETYGVYTKIHYIDYARDKVDSRLIIKDNLEIPLFFYWVYPIEKLEEFKKTLVNATGLQIELKTEATE